MVDLQKCLPTPLLKNAQSFYSLELWTFNFTVYDSSTKSASCYVWDESQAGRGGNEIGSCLRKFILSLNCEVKKIIIWSDNCPSQNRNIQIIMCYLSILQPRIDCTRQPRAAASRGMLCGMYTCLASKAASLWGSLRVSQSQSVSGRDQRRLATKYSLCLYPTTLRFSAALKMDNEKCILLIDLYKEHIHNNNHNNNIREDVWKEISLILEIPVDQLKTKIVIDGDL